ncbi:glutathione S-transferase family protein [Asaia sp. VD9]|uniref:glutathione S-transferase family protein n=1 Tax=Asaia sp. VD9 TaxID=3081235 RepID=UPI003019E8B7
MLILHGWMMDERSYAVRLAAALMHIPLEIITDRRAEIYGPTLNDEEGYSNVGLYDVLLCLARQSGSRWSWPEGEDLTCLKWALEGLEVFSAARRRALIATMPGNAETEEVTLVLRGLEDRLSRARLAGNPWLCGERIGFADIVAFPIAGLARDLGVSMDFYPAIRRFVRTIRELPEFVVMPGIAACH